jgi:chorismate mutase
MAAVVRGIRGATTLDEDSVEQVYKRVQALVAEMLGRNGVEHEDIVSMIFTVTDDVTAAFPAAAARAMGLHEVPLLGAREMVVSGDPPRCVRVLAHVYSERSRAEIVHVYLEGAVQLRPDLSDT